MISDLQIDIKRRCAEVDALKYQIETRYSPANDLTPELFRQLLPHRAPDETYDADEAEEAGETDEAREEAIRTNEAVVSDDDDVPDASADFCPVKQEDDSVIVLEEPVTVAMQPDAPVEAPAEAPAEPEIIPDVVMNVVPLVPEKKSRSRTSKRLVL